MANERFLGVVVESMDSVAYVHGLESQHHFLPALWPPVHFKTSLYLYLFICKKGVIIESISQNCYKD